MLSKETHKEKQKAANKARTEIEKLFGKGSIMYLTERQNETVPAIPTGCLSLDQALGGFGYPRGRVIEIFGPESSGKTTLSLHAIAQCQRNNAIAAFIDAEHALDVYYAEKIGVKLDSLLVSQPDYGEQAIDIVEMLVRCGGIDLIVVDSVAALVPRAEIEGEMSDQHVGLQARLMSKALRKLTGIVNRTDTTIIFINQLRMKIGVMFGSPETTSGGQALKYYSTVRLDIRRIGPVKKGDEIIGNRTRVKVVKNKMAPPFRIAEFDIRYGLGIDALGDLLDCAVAQEVVEKRGAYYCHENNTIGQGRERAREALSSDPALCEAIAKKMLSRQRPNSSDTVGSEDKAA